MEWNAEAIDRLRALWAEGHSTAEIGRRMGVSKNAVVGKAHRLSLPARPSPIRRDVIAAPRPAPARRHTLPPLRAALREPLPQVGSHISTMPSLPRANAMLTAPASIPVARPTSPASRPFPRVGMKSCCWPIGEPGTTGFTFCAAEALMAKPYCAEHAAIAYVKVREPPRGRRLMVPLPERGFGYAPGVFQYSCGVIALPGFRMERAPLPSPGTVG